MASSVDDQYDYSWKVVVVVGDSGVGKTNLAARFTRNEFNFNKQTTIGVEVFTRSTTIDGKMVIAHIWDTAGMDRYRAITSAYYRGVVGVMVVYDLTKPQSFQNLGKWLEEMKEHTGSSVCIMLVGNKTDLGHLRAVTMEEGRSLAEKMNFSFAETSALDTTNVEEAFSHLLVDIFKTQVEEQGEPPSTPVTNANDGLNVPDNPSTPDSDGQEGMGCVC